MMTKETSGLIESLRKKAIEELLEKCKLPHDITRVRMLLKDPTTYWAEKTTTCPVCLGAILRGRLCFGPGFKGENAWVHPDCRDELYIGVSDVPNFPKWVHVVWFDLLDPTVRHQFYGNAPRKA